MSMVKLNLVDTASKEDFINICNQFSTFSCIIEASVLYSYERFLGIAIGYVLCECKKRRISISELNYLASQIAEVINNTGKKYVGNAQQEREDIKRILKDKASRTDFKNIPDASLLSKMEMDFNQELYDFIVQKPLLKKAFINYILKKENIIQKYSALDLYNIHDFINNFINKCIQKGNSVNMTAEEMLSDLKDIIKEEKEKFRASTKNQAKYSNRYPNLTKSLLLVTTREEINELTEEYKNEELFVYFLGRLLSLLSCYDSIFLRGIEISISASELSKRNSEMLEGMLANNKVFLSLNSRSAVEAAISELSEDKLKSGDYVILPKDLIKSMPNSFIEEMKQSYKDGGENLNAEKLSLLISKYCISSNNRKYSPEIARKALDREFNKITERAY